MSNPDDRDMLAAEYVLGTLDAAERANVASRLGADADLALAVAAWEDRLSPLLDGVHEIAPPADAGAARAGGRFTGEVASTNIVAASVEAYVVALNAMLGEGAWASAAEDAGARRTGPGSAEGYQGDAEYLHGRTIDHTVALVAISGIRAGKPPRQETRSAHPDATTRPTIPPVGGSSTVIAKQRWSRHAPSTSR